jgi:2-oxoisovalerate dehydrogenase E1 component alpha subunit
LKTIAEFRIQYSQFLDARGEPLGPLPDFARTPAELLKMYRMMTLVRAFDTRAINLQRTGKLGTYASCLGHEATHVGTSAAMRPDDVLVPMYREYGAQLWRGVKMSDALLYWGGDERGSNFAAPAEHDFAWCVPIGSQTLHATGVAMAFKIRGERRAAVAFLGDGSTSEGAFYEAMNLAGVQALPVVFVIVNNKWAISVPVASQTATETLAQKAIAAGIAGIQVDGNDVIAVRHVVGEALANARNGRGPTVIEAITYRLSDHTTADDATRYRKEQEVEEARRTEPLLRLRAYLVAGGAWDAAREAALIAECAAEVDAAVQEYLNTPRQSTDAMFDHLYARLPRNVQEQREMARRYAGSSGH